MVFMASFIIVLFSIFCCDVHVVFEVSLLVEVRLRASLSAPERTTVADDAPALSSALLFPSTTTKIQCSNVIMSRV
jgi:hypothetical protein